MLRLSKILPLAATAAVIALAATPSQAFVGYGIEAGTPLYDALTHGYRPAPYFRHPTVLPQR